MTICKRCEVNQIKPERMINGYCRHCQGAIPVSKWYTDEEKNG
jgi:hypothetical protein